MVALAPLAAAGALLRQGIELVGGSSGRDALKTFDEVSGHVRSVRDRTMHGESRSLTQKLRQSFITSRVFIDGSLHNDDIVKDITRTAEIIYVGLLTNAVEMDHLVDGINTVSDHLSRIQTHEFEALNAVVGDFTDSTHVFEELNNSLVKSLAAHIEVSNEAKTDAFADEEEAKNRRFPLTSGESETNKEYNQRLKDQTNRNLLESKHLQSQEFAPTPANVTATDMTMKSGPLPPTGRFVKLKLRDPRNNVAIDLPIVIQIYPFVINPITMGHILAGYGVSATAGHRWLQFRAGEITFWKDLIFNQDRARKMARDLRNDRTGHLAGYLNGIAKKDKFRFLENIARLGLGKAYRPSSNLLNSTIIASEDALIRAKADGAGNFDDFATRQKFFDSSYAMLLFIVDPNHEQVRMYINGMQQVAHFKYRDFKEKKDGDNSKDLLKVIASLAAGRAAQF